MATFLQWWKKKPLRKVAWVCGDQGVLVREVVSAYREGAPPDQCAVLFAGDVPEREVWDALLSGPVGGGRRTVVYGAGRLKEAGYAALLAGFPGLDATYTVFVADGADFPREDGALVPHLAALQAHRAAQLIRCCEPSKTEDRTALVASWWPGATLNFAYDVLVRCGNLENAYLACEQARMAGLEPSPRMAAVVCPAQPGGDFADLLMSGDKRSACAAAGQLSTPDLGAAIGLLAARLSVAEQIGDEVRHGLSLREAAQRGQVDRFVASRVAPHVAAYTTERIRRCRKVLAVAETAWRAGTRAGIAESLVALW